MIIIHILPPECVLRRLDRERARVFACELPRIESVAYRIEVDGNVRRVRRAETRSSGGLSKLHERGVIGGRRKGN